MLKAGVTSMATHTLCGEVVEACIDVRAKLEEGICSRVSGSESVLILSW